MSYTVLPLQNIAELRTRRGNATFPNAATVSGLDYPTSQGYSYYVWDEASTATDDGVVTITPTVGDTTHGRWIRCNFQNNITGLQTVALTGSYTDLSNKPTIPAAQVNADWNSSTGVSQILNKPAIPAAQVNSDWNSTSGISQVLNKPTLAAVATSGAYADLSGQPTIPRATLLYNNSGIIAQPIKIWAASIVPTTASGFTVSISSAGFSTIACVQVTGQQDISTIQGALASVKADSTSQLTINVYRSAVTGVLLLNTQVPGLEFHPTPSSVTLNILVVGY